MTPTTRLTTLIASLLAAPALTACGPPLDDEACLSVDFQAACPSDEVAANQLIGDQTCTDPVRKVVNTGTLVSETDVEAYEGPYGPVEAHRECCYEAGYRTLKNMSCTPGRPIRVAGEALTADDCPGADWRADALPSAPAARDRQLAAQWRRDAALEHASVASFARLALDLLALGAPAELVTRATEAQADEIRHARQCYALAAALDGRDLGPGPLPVPGRPPIDLLILAVEAFEEGCVGETLAVCRAAVQLRATTDPAARAVLEGILADEQRHAALAWDLVRWALQTGGPEVREALLAARARVTLPDEALVDAPGWALRQAFDAAWTDVIAPGTDALLAA